MQCSTTESQTNDSGIETDDEDVPKEFQGVKKAVMAKKLADQRNTMKALQDQIDMQKDQIKELGDVNNEKDELINTKQIYIDKLQQRVKENVLDKVQFRHSRLYYWFWRQLAFLTCLKELSNDLDAQTNKNDDLIDKMKKLSDENVRLIDEIGKLRQDLEGKLVHASLIILLFIERPNVISQVNTQQTTVNSKPSFITFR